ncbi:MAG: VanW family protein [Marmoricola sp.]|nr:VanW family protein [Marmoricola sp.]
MADNLGARVAGLTVLGLFVLAAAAWGGLYLYAGDHTPRNARVEGISIAGLGPDEAEQRLRDGLRERVREPIGITYGDGRSKSVDPAEAGLSVDYAASVREAGGGSGFGLRRMWAVATGGEDRRAEITVDQSRMQPALDGLDSGIARPPTEGTVTFSDGRATAVLGRPGLVVNRAATQALLERRFLHGGSQKVPTETRQPAVSDEAVQRALARFGRPAMSGPVTLVLGGQQVVAPPRLFAAGLSMVEQDGELVPRVDGELMLEALAPEMRTVGREPVDARVVVRRGKPRVVPAKVGVELDPAEIEDAFARAAVATGAQRRIVVKGRATQPAFTTADAKALRITERVSTFTTNFPYADYRNINLPRAAELINGTVLRPGETFSLNGIVGERTEANGFTEGYVVSDGIFKKDLGGGVSQIATTTFNAMFFAGLEDVQHKPHSVYIDRYPEGREATVAWPTVDLRFTNSTPYGVLVTADVRKSTPSTQGAATVSMYSTRKWRITSTTGPRTDFRQPAVRYVQDVDCEEFSGTQGFSVDVFRYFRDLSSDKVLRKEKFHTDYIAGDTVRCGAPPQPKPQPKPKPKPKPQPKPKPKP